MSDKPNGHGVDRSGGPVIDPTANVDAAIEAAVRRIDDLRTATVQRVDDLRGADEKLANERFRHTEFVANLRASHSREMRTGDNDRLAAIRLVDQARADADKKTVLDAVQVLAATTESNRLQLEKRVADTAETLSKAKTESDKATEIRIAGLEKTSFIGAGEKSIADPRMNQLIEVVEKLAADRQSDIGERRFSDPATKELAESVKQLVTAQTNTSGQWGGANKLWLLITGAVLFFLALSGRINLISPVAQSNPIQVAPK